jgi:hypothetical protein
VVLCLDLAGVVTVGIVGAALASQSTAGSSGALDAALVGACALVAAVTWLLAVLAVSRVVRGRPRPARVLTVVGLLFNSLGTLTIATCAFLLAAASSAAAAAHPPAAGIAGLAIAAAGALLSAAYLALIPRPPSAETSLSAHPGGEWREK